MTSLILQRPSCALLLVLILGLFACQGGSSGSESLSCEEAFAHVAQMRLEKRNPRMARENARRHAKQIANATKSSQIAECEELSSNQRKTLTACVEAADTISEGQRCLASL